MKYYFSLPVMISTALLLLCWAFCITADSENTPLSRVSVRFLQVPPSFSNQDSAAFSFEAFIGETDCSNCSFTCKLDEGISSNCEGRIAFFSGLQDGLHTIMVCANASRGVGCDSHNWTVDTVPPTAYITAKEFLTNEVNVSVNISFSEPCSFRCSTTSTCNLIVYGDGKVVPQTLTILEPNLNYSIIVALSSSTMYGRAILVMGKGFCEDAAGNRFTRAENSSFTIHFDRRSVNVYLKTHVPEKLVELNGQSRTVHATNDDNKLKVYLYFSQRIVNTTDEIMRSLNVSRGLLQPIQGKRLASRRFGYLLKDIPSVSVVTISLMPDMILSEEGNWVNPVSAATLLYDSERPGVMLSTTSKTRTKDESIRVTVRFTKPVFSFNSTQLLIYGGHIQSFHQVSRCCYAANIKATDNAAIYIKILENVTSDIAGNKNLPSNVLQVRHYATPVGYVAVGYFVTASFLATCFLAGLLTISTAFLQYAGVISKSRPSLTSDPTRNLFRIASYIQLFVLSRWLVDTLPIEYYELTACLKWSVPYFKLPWERENDDGHLPMFGPVPSSSQLLSFPGDISTMMQSTNINKATVVDRAPLTATEYMYFFESQSYSPLAVYVPNPQDLDGWMDFKRSMFWVAVIAAVLVVLHIIPVLTLKLRNYSREKRRYGALVLPRFEIMLLMLSVPCICKASVSIIKGGTRVGSIVGVLGLLFASSLQLALFAFLTFGITLGKLLQYKEVHQVGQKSHWYQELVRVSLGPGKRGQWTWKDQQNTTKLTQLGPLFEDLRGPPKYMVSQFSTSSRNADSIIASDDETEDAEAPLIQKIFGILRVYYTLVESLKRFFLGLASSGTPQGPHPSKAPTVVALLAITCFQLFFLVLKKPFIKKKVQLVEIVSIASQVGMFSTLAALKEDRIGSDNKLSILMLTFFMLGYLVLLLNEWYALLKQIKRLDTEERRFRVGLRTAFAGLLLFCFPEKLDKRLLESNGSRRESRESTNGTTPPMARSGDEASNEHSRWSKFWSRSRSGYSSKGSSADDKAKPVSKTNNSGALYRDMEAIFAASSTPHHSGPAPAPETTS